MSVATFDANFLAEFIYAGYGTGIHSQLLRIEDDLARGVDLTRIECGLARDLGWAEKYSVLNNAAARARYPQHREEFQPVTAAEVLRALENLVRAGKGLPAARRNRLAPEETLDRGMLLCYNLDGLDRQGQEDITGEMVHVWIMRGAWSAKEQAKYGYID